MKRLLLLLLLPLTRASTDTCPNQADCDEACSLFLGSTSERGYGVYTSRDLQPNELVGGEGNVAIEWMMDASQPQASSSSDNNDDALPDWLLERHDWDSVNSHLILPGLALLCRAGESPNLQLKGCSDTRPTSSAETDCHNVTVTARQFIPAGHELFVKTKQHAPSDDTALALPVTRSVDWLAQHGWCLDQIQGKLVPKDEQPSWGAFATRRIVQGSVVSPVPVWPVHRRHVQLHKGHQLLLNYCLGHVHSSLLFFPFGHAIHLINHGSPNVALRWFNASGLASSMEEILQAKQPLLKELVALQDIRPGEEILLDYGQAWQLAWDRHVARSPPKTKKSAWHYNQAGQIQLPLASHIQAYCWVDRKAMLQNADKWYEYASLSSRALVDAEPCRLMEKNREEQFRIVLLSDDVQVKNVPRQAITLVDKPYTCPKYHVQAFRHEIQLPDDMLLDEWKDLESPDDDDKCGLYMAESAIPNAGLGMFTAKPVAADAKIYSGDVVANVEDIGVNMKLSKWFYRQGPQREWLLEHYFWNPQNAMAHYEAADIQSIIPGLGMLANSHPSSLVNAKIMPPKRVADLHRGRDPGAGASTTFHDSHYIAAHGPIEAGAEIFVEYGDSWFENRKDLGMLPLSQNFVYADRLIDKYMKLVNNDTSTSVANDIWTLVREAAVGDDRLANALPMEAVDVEHVHPIGTAKNSVPNRVRSPEWLKTNGRCLDNIQPGLSTVRQAGHGAFATRKIPKGSVIAPLPLVQVRRRHMEVFDSENVEDPSFPVSRVGTQLLLNYCYGHPQSSLLLFPYSPVVNYVNHNKTNFNAELQWSNLPNHHTDWLQRTPNDLEKEDHAGLIMEMTATRDIEKGEEIFLNYGDSWDQAWQKYVANEWNPSEEDKNYVSATELNEQMAWLKTEAELRTDPYPWDNVMTACFIGSFHPIAPPNMHGLASYEWQLPSGLLYHEEYMYPCDILGRHVEGDWDMADVFDRSDSINPVDIWYTARVPKEDDEDAIVHNIPRHAIQFFDVEYTSDLFLRSAFRHEIHLPDHMVPAAWRDLK